MIIKKMLRIKWAYNFEGGAYYTDEQGNGWYDFRKSLDANAHIILVDSITRNIINYYNGPDPSMIGLFADRNMSLDVYQLDSFPVDSWEEFAKRKFKFVNDEVIMTEDVYTPPARTKEDIMSDLIALKAELESLS